MINYHKNLNKGVNMFIKKGYLIQREERESKPLIQNPEGHSYEVSHVVAFVWDKLDGRTSLKEVSTNMEKQSEVTDVDYSKIVENVVSELEKVNLVASMATS